MTIITLAKAHQIARDAVRQYARDSLFKAIGKVIGENRRELEQRIIKLEEAMKEFTFKGTWTEGAQYKRGNFVSMGGSIYHCEHDTASRPGSDNNWTIAVKSGRDGRDGRDAPTTPEPPPQRTATRATSTR